MLADGTRLLRLGLLASTLTIAATFPIEAAWADDDEEDEDEDEDDDDEEEEDDDEEEEEEEDEDQPPVTAGGLWTKKTYPISEIERPLTLTKGLKEVRMGIDMDMSAEGAFETWGLGFNLRVGIEDNSEVFLDFRSQLNNFSDADVATGDLTARVGYEGSISYDLVDFKIALAVPYSDNMGDSSTQFDVEFGFPFRYAPKPQVAITALETFMTINFDGKPDLTPAVGIVVQPVPVLAVKMYATLIIPEFNTNADFFIIPVSANIQFSPNNLLDIGGEFTFPNLKPPAPAGGGEAPKFFDSRFLFLYGQIRI